jgi:hypothetical protein
LIAHVILFRPKSDLSEAERDGLFDAMRAAHHAIPQIRRFGVGKRILSGRPYEALGRDFPFFALLEFNTAADLDTYLTHPAHAQLGERFYLTSDSAEAYDYSLEELPAGLKVLSGD